MTEYLIPSCTGLNSSTRAVTARVRRLISALDNEITSWVVDDRCKEIVEDVRAFRIKLVERLRADGWTITYAAGNARLVVKAPKRGRS